jgi:DNA repair protein RecO (recombination protein O)
MGSSSSGPVKTTGIVLARWDFGNTSRVLCFLTPDRGRVHALYKGARRPKGGAGLGGGLDLLSENEILYYQRRGGGLAVLAEWSELYSPGPELGRSPVRFVAAEALAEYARECSSEGEEPGRLYALLAAGTRLVAGTGRLVPTVLSVTLGMLSAAGFRPVAEACAACGQRPSDGKWLRPATLSAEQGGLLCESCAGARRTPASAGARAGRLARARSSGDVPLSGEGCALLGALLRLTPEGGARLRPSRRAEGELLRAVELYGSWRLERRLRSLSAMEKVIARLEAVGCR